MRHPALMLAFLAALLFLPTACGGGGGGGGGAGTDALLGTYRLCQFRGDIGPPLTATAVWSTIDANGLGEFTGGTSQDISNGVVSLPTSVATSEYQILSGNILEMRDGPLVVARGGVSADGSLLNFAVVLPGIGARVAFGARQESGQTVASLNGRYHYAQFLTSPGGNSDISFWGWVDFDGGGNASLTLWTHVDGVPSAGSSVVPGSYTVAPNGDLALSFAGATFVGGVTRAGSLGMFAGSRIAGGPAGVGIFIKYSTAATAATFSGTYHTMAIFANPVVAPASNWLASIGRTVSDGAGNWTYVERILIDDAGTFLPSSGPFLPTPYTMAANGGMLVGGSSVGAVSSDGSVAAVVGSTVVAPGQGPLLFVMIR